MVGMATAAVVARVTHAPGSALLWLGAFVASGVPDLDTTLALFGLSGPRYHRNLSHALPVLASVVVGGWFLVSGLPGSGAPAVWWAWSGALISHPLLDVATTGPVMGARGYGIPLLWPFSAKRWFLQRPILETADFGACRSVRDVWDGIRPELVRIAPAALIVLAVAAFA